MKILEARQQTKVKPWTLKIDTFKGCATVLDDVIAGKEYAVEAKNMIQEQDGRWTERWGRQYYGLAISGETSILGVETFVKTDGTRELVAVGASGTAYKSTDGGSWSAISGATFNTSAKDYYFKQINNFLFICNGYDNLTRYNGSVLIRYSAISAPTGQSGSRGAGLSSGSYNNYYVITAVNEVGETVASGEVSVPTNKVRDVWNPTNNEYIDLTWTAVSGATAYQVYYSDLSGKGELLAYTTVNSYKDDNSGAVNIYKTPSLTNTTGAPKFSMIATSGSRIWGIAPRETKWRYYFSGVGQYLGVFSDAYGGGWGDLDSGSDEEVSFIEHFRSGKGDNVATIFCKSPGGGGSVWQVSLVGITVAEETIIVPDAQKIVGSVGASAPGAALLVGDVIMFLSQYGVSDLSNKENVTNVLSTTMKSGLIRPSYLGLNFSKAEQFRGYEYKNFVFFTATEGAGENDLIFIYDKDLDRWYWKWDFGVRQFLEYTDSIGNTRFLMVPTSGNRLVECSVNLTSDFGAPIKTSLLTGLIPVSEDLYDFVNLQEVLLVLGRTRGTVGFEIFGMTKKKGFVSLASRTISESDGLIAGEFWTGYYGEVTLKGEEQAPRTYSQATIRKRKKINKIVSSVQFRIYSETADTQYSVLAIQAKGIYQPSDRPPSSWN